MPVPILTKLLPQAFLLPQYCMQTTRPNRRGRTGWRTVSASGGLTVSLPRWPLGARVGNRRTALSHSNVCTWRKRTCGPPREGPIFTPKRSSTTSIRATTRCGTSSRSSAETSSLRLDAGELDHLAPLLGFVGDELAEIGRRAGKRHCPEVRKPRLQRGIGEASIDLPIEPLDDCEGRILRHAEPEIAARLIARNEFVYGRNVRQRFRTRQRAHR